MPANAPIAGQFDQDERVSFDTIAGKYQYEDEETGQEYEWSELAAAWIPLIDESQWKAQQAAYSVAGVDENTPANAVVATEERRNRKRKKPDTASVIPGLEQSTTSSSSNGKKNGSVKGPGAAPSSSAAGPSTYATSGEKDKDAQPPAPPKKTAVYVTGLPTTVTVDQLASVFSKAGVLMIGNDGEPRIKLYYDDDGKFKGEALVMYFKEGSVDLAITLLDDTELELGAGAGNMHVKVAEYDKSAKKTNEEKKKKEEGLDKDGLPEKKKYTAEEKLKMTKRIKRLQEKVTWHSDDELEDDSFGPNGGAPQPGQSRYNRVVVLKGMFTLADLEKDPALLLDLKEDVREECETLGQVTSCTLFDKEEDGVMTIKFKDSVSAQACVSKMNGRFFDGRKIFAGLFTGKERYRRSGKGIDEDDDNDERARLDNFASWLVDEDGEAA